MTTQRENPEKDYFPNTTMRLRGQGYQFTELLLNKSHSHLECGNSDFGSEEIFEEIFI